MMFRFICALCCLATPVLRAQSPTIYPHNVVRYQPAHKTKIRISDTRFIYQNGTLTLVSFKLHNNSDRTLVAYRVGWILTLSGEKAHPSLGSEARGSVAPPHSVVEFSNETTSSISGPLVTKIRGQVLYAEFDDGSQFKLPPRF